MPAPADIDTSQLQRHRSAAASIISSTSPERLPYLVVVQRQRFVDLAKVQVIHGGVPPVVHGEEAVARPQVRVGAHPPDAIALAARHLVHVCHRVLRPAVTRLELHRVPAGALGADVIAAFLEPERMHAEQGGDARASARSMRATARAMRSRSMCDWPGKKSSWRRRAMRAHRAGVRWPHPRVCTQRRHATDPDELPIGGTGARVLACVEGRIAPARSATRGTRHTYRRHGRTCQQPAARSASLTMSVADTDGPHPRYYRVTRSKCPAAAAVLEVLETPGGVMAHPRNHAKTASRKRRRSPLELSGAHAVGAAQSVRISDTGCDLLIARPARGSDGCCPTPNRRRVRPHGASSSMHAFSAAPWCVHSQVEPGEASPIARRPGHISSFHNVVAGTLVVMVWARAGPFATAHAAISYCCRE